MKAKLGKDELKTFALELAAAMPPAESKQARAMGLEAADEYIAAITNLRALVDFTQLASYSKEVINREHLAAITDLMLHEIARVEGAVEELRIQALGE